VIEVDCSGDVPGSDEELLARQAALQKEARQLLTTLDLAALVADIGPLLLAGSFVSGLMCWRDLDVMVLAGGDFSPQDVLRLLQRIVGKLGVTAFEYHDERGPRCVTGQVRDERYHVPVAVDWAGHYALFSAEAVVLLANPVTGHRIVACALAARFQAPRRACDGQPYRL
jgi:hypothetical protein